MLNISYPDGAKEMRVGGLSMLHHSLILYVTSLSMSDDGFDVALNKCVIVYYTGVYKYIYINTRTCVFVFVCACV